MPVFTQRLDNEQLNDDQLQQLKVQQEAGNYLSLDFDTRQRSRFKADTQSGITIGVDLPRTETLKRSCVLADANSNLMQVFAADQALTCVTTQGDEFLLMKAAYHLGNRHVPLMITPSALFFEPDHVLSDMLVRLGVHVEDVNAPFESETGAYQSGHAHGGHSHDNQSHSHSHSHSHDDHSHSH
ncbi:urease accessory protein UreE [Psychrobacter arenosus]|uniref:urease accessory protein UreE n=1 Tax=Psychrobacter arenosus TaxID=256326 RepID=UPI001919895B